jgi:hypothetical protein
LDTAAASGTISWVGGITGKGSANDGGPGSYTAVTRATGDELAGAGADGIWPIYSGSNDLAATPDAASAARSNAYGDGATGVARWCATCHDEFHETVTAANDAGGGGGTSGDWRRHPVDEGIYETGLAGTSGSGVSMIDITNYDVTIGGQVLPVTDGANSNRVFYLFSGANGEDKVFCLSCHFAHGGQYLDNLRWDYVATAGVGTLVGKGVSSVRGCQLCHNR